MQDFGPAVGAAEQAAKAYADKDQSVKVSVQALAYDDLFSKVLPAVAAGNEADIIMGYTNWYVATDISRVFLPLNDYMGDVGSLSETIYPAAFTALPEASGKLYYLPWLSGLNVVTTTVNVSHYKEAKVDYTKFATWEDLVAGAQEATITKDGKITRNGLDVGSGVAPVQLMKSWIWQLGGEYYSAETGKWTFNTPEGEAAAQRIYDLYWGPKPVTAFGLYNSALEGMTQGLVATQLAGAWSMGYLQSTVKELGLDNVPTPPLTGAKANTVYPDHFAVISLSRRLAQDENKLKHAINIAKNMLQPDALIGITEVYTGSLLSKALYSDPRVQSTKYGPVSKRMAEAVWPRAKFPRDHVANQTPAGQELDRALRKEISVKEALANIDTYLNEQETQARQRLGL